MRADGRGVYVTRYIEVYHTLFPKSKAFLPSLCTLYSNSPVVTPGRLLFRAAFYSNSFLRFFSFLILLFAYFTFENPFFTMKENVR